MNINEYEMFLVLENQEQQDKTLVMEPLTPEFQLPSGSKITLHLLGPTPIMRALPQISYTEGFITFYVWPGAAFEVYRDGVLISKPITECLRERIPNGWYVEP